MTVDLFNQFNLLVTNPTAFSTSGNSSALANTQVVNSYVAVGPRSAFIWSEALSMAALDYVNQFG